MKEKDITKIVNFFIKPPEFKIISLSSSLEEMVRDTGLSEEIIINNIIKTNNIKSSFILEYETNDIFYTNNNELSKVLIYRHYTSNNKLLRTIIKTKNERYVSINDFKLSTIATIIDGKINKMFKYKNGKTEVIDFDDTGSLKSFRISKYKKFIDTIILKLKVNKNNIEIKTEDTTINKKYGN